MGAGVGMLLGGNLLVIGIAFVAAVAVDLLQRAMSRRRLPGFYQQVAGGLLATMFAIAARWPTWGRTRLWSSPPASSCCSLGSGSAERSRTR